MERITYVRKDGITYALLCKQPKVPAEGIRFFTEPTDEFQAGVMERPAGYTVKPHTHPPSRYPIDTLSEFLYVERGKIHVTVYDKDWKVLSEEVLTGGDFFLFFRGGHGIEVIEDCRMIEVKQGPYREAAITKIFRDPV